MSSQAQQAKRLTADLINPRYLAGISDEPKQLLQPISGYASEPLLPLEEACEPLQSIIPRLSTYVWIAKENSKDPQDGLTHDESAAVRLYTMEWDTDVDGKYSSLYSQLNRTLKLVDRSKLRPWFRYLKLFLTALAKLPPVPHQTIWRGVKKNHSDEYAANSQVTWWSFSSCTTSLKVLESDLYLGSTGTRTLFSIEAINGRSVRSHSHFQVEDEILLLPGTYLEVKSQFNPAPDLHIIHLCQRRPPHDLLEPPFEGAEFFLTEEPVYNIPTKPRHETSIRRRRQKRFYFDIGVLIALLILFTIVAALLTVRYLSTPAPMITASTTFSTVSLSTTASPFYNRFVPDPVSIADAFFSFDNNTQDLYNRRHATIIGGPVSYVRGYIASGQAIVFSQSSPTHLQITTPFNLTRQTSFIIEGFFYLTKTLINAHLIQLTSNIRISLLQGRLAMAIRSRVRQQLNGTSVVSTDAWHHLAFTHDADQRQMSVYIDGELDGTMMNVSSMGSNETNGSVVLIGVGYEGYIDQLSVSLKSKPVSVIRWDATVLAYYPMDGQKFEDKGPYGLHAIGNRLTPIYGWLKNAISFNHKSAYFEKSGFTALGTPRKAFSIALWVRAETQPGIFLTVSNAATCLLALALQNSTNRLVAHFPRSTVTGESVTVIGPQMPLNNWVHVTVTWSVQNRAQLYTSGYLQNSDSEVTRLSNTRGGNCSLPMTVTLGHKQGVSQCGDIDDVNSFVPFMGSIDELYIFARELSHSEINAVLTP